MSEEELLRHYEKLLEIYGDDLPNPEQEPLRFKYFVTLYKYFDMAKD